MDDIHFDTVRKSDRLKEVIRESILRGDLKPGDQLPSEPAMLARYRVSRGAVREAIAALAHEGLVTRIQGKGTFVADAAPYRPTIAVVLPYLFFSESAHYSAGTDVAPRLMQAIESEARRLGMNIMLYLDNHEPRIERENITNLLESNIDGIVLVYIGVDQNLDCFARIREAGVPLVLVDRYIDDFGDNAAPDHRMELNYVVTDNMDGAYRAARRFIDSGFDTIFYMTSPVHNTTLRDRLGGYRRAVEESGLEARVLTIDTATAHIDPEELRAYRVAKSLAKDSQPARYAVLTADAPTLAGVWQAIEEAQTPHDRFALACFDDPFLTLPPAVRLIKIIQPFQEIGHRCVHILSGQIVSKRRRGPAPEPRQLKLKPEILEHGPF